MHFSAPVPQNGPSADTDYASSSQISHPYISLCGIIFRIIVWLVTAADREGASFCKIVSKGVIIVVGPLRSSIKVM